MPVLDTPFDPAELEIFKNLYASVAEEMGITLGRTAYSINIKERRDYSCAVFDSQGRLIAQAAHIPVHLGAMPSSVQAAIEACHPQRGDVVILNDPYLGGTHLPDITLVSPIFLPPPENRLFGYLGSRAHHADVGGISPASMPLSTELYQEGLIIPPVKLMVAGRVNQALLQLIYRNVRTPEERRGDLAAQLAAHQVGERRMLQIIERYGVETVERTTATLLSYAERLTRRALGQIAPGTYTFEDYLDGDGQSEEPVVIRVSLTVADGEMTVDFSGTSPERPGSINAVFAVAQSAVYYLVRCIVGEEVPANQGCFAPVKLVVPEGTVLNPRPPRAVAAGNVETSQRIVDVLFGALAQALPAVVPAASQGTMNNVSAGGHDPFHSKPYTYYETIGGGGGGRPTKDGASAIHVHMTNTMNTPVEALEFAYPLRVQEYAIRRNSGGAGMHRGGDGLRRCLEFLAPATVTILSERRRFPPYGLGGGQPGSRGRNVLYCKGEAVELKGKATFAVDAGDVLCVETPGGGGWGKPSTPA